MANLEDIANELDQIAMCSATDVFDYEYELTVLANAIRANLGHDDLTGYCNCSCCDHGL